MSLSLLGASPDRLSVPNRATTQHENITSKDKTPSAHTCTFKWRAQKKPLPLPPPPIPKHSTHIEMPWIKVLSPSESETRTTSLRKLLAIDSFGAGLPAPDIIPYLHTYTLYKHPLHNFPPTVPTPTAHPGLVKTSWCPSAHSLTQNFHPS